MVSRVKASEQRLAANNRKMGAETAIKQAERICARDIKLAGAGRGSIRHPKRLVPVGILRGEQHLAAENRKIGFNAGKQSARGERPCNCQLAGSRRCPVRNPEIAIVGGICPLEYNLAPAAVTSLVPAAVPFVIHRLSRLVAS